MDRVGERSESRRERKRDGEKGERVDKVNLNNDVAVKKSIQIS